MEELVLPPKRGNRGKDVNSQDVCSDDETRSQHKMDVARIMVKMKYTIVLNEAFNVAVNKEVFRIKLV